MTAANVAFLVLSLGWLRLRSPAADFGLSYAKARLPEGEPASLVGDLRLGGLVFLVSFLPVMVLQFLLSILFLPLEIAPDPIPLFFFFAVSGYVYERTHRLLPSIVAHVCFNGTSLLLAWLLRGVLDAGS